MSWVFSEQLTEEQKNIDASPGETVTIIAELPEEGLDVVWMKDNIPLSMSQGKYETVNKDCSYELVIPDVTVEDGGEYKIQGREYESTVSLTVKGYYMYFVLHSLFNVIFIYLIFCCYFFNLLFFMPCRLFHYK